MIQINLEGNELPGFGRLEFQPHPVWQGKLSSPTSVDLARVSKYPGCYWEILINFWKIEISRERPIHCWNSRSLWEVIKSCSFLDMGFSDPAYTWSSSRARIAYIKERLDHAWCNELWSSGKWAKKRISKLQDYNGERIDDEQHSKTMALEFYKKLYFVEQVDIDNTTDWNFPTLNREEKRCLHRYISEA
ncbi:hypothetical protein M9H77_04036 [Catharanthus roseus]|uniref:Uncharacterized protein n=1 Tax=Catharanthus roseus TaxID=4058 RepID=A0ACC0CCV9_CATRO|nr:hypothetical protein M9H77_04036 [Catharanthus roseus]